MSTSRIRAFEPEIFRILLKTYPERIARVASVALFWSQLAQHRHHGKLGIFKTDADLGEVMGRHGKTAGKNLMEVCTPWGQSSRTALFEVTYGPKAGQDSGRCRWLFLTPRGEQIIQLAHEDRAMRAEVKRHRACDDRTRASVLFGGFEMPQPSVEQWVQKLLERRLDF